MTAPVDTALHDSLSEEGPRYTDATSDTFPRLVANRLITPASTSRNTSRVYYRDATSYHPPSSSYETGQQVPSCAHLVGEEDFRQLGHYCTLSNSAMSPKDPTPEPTKPTNPPSAGLKEYYDKHFNVRGVYNPPRDQVGRSSPIIAELRTTARLHDDQQWTMTSTLSKELSECYHRPESSILVYVIHSACLLIDGRARPAYLLTISALESQLSPAMNQWRIDCLTPLLRGFLGAEPAHSVIRFLSLNDADLAQGDITMRACIDDMEKKEARNEVSSAGAARGALKRAFTRSRLGLSSTSAKDDKESMPQTPTRPPLKVTAPSSDSVKPHTPLNKNENTTRWPTPPSQRQAEAGPSDENQRPMVSFEDAQRHKSGTSSTQAVKDGVQAQKMKKRKSLFQLLKGK